MENVLITVGAITTAVRFSKLLYKETGYNASVVHTPAEINKGGCSYSVKTADVALPYIRAVANKYNIPIKKVYVIKRHGRESEYFAIP